MTIVIFIIIVHMSSFEKKNASRNMLKKYTLYLVNTIDTSVLWGYVLLLFLVINILHNVYCVKRLNKHILLLFLNSYLTKIIFVSLILFCAK